MPSAGLVVVADADDPIGQALAIQAAAAGARTTQVHDLAAARDLLAERAGDVELVLMVEVRPGQTSSADIDRLRRLAPLARIWRIRGSWCEGELRSGNAPPGCLNTYWHQSLASLSRELADRAGGARTAWSLPVTASPEERALADAQRPLARGCDTVGNGTVGSDTVSNGTVGICAPRRETVAALFDAVSIAGYGPRVIDMKCLSGEATAGQTLAAQVVSAQATDDALRAVLWDTRPDELDDEAVRALRAAVGQAPVLVFLDFPRPEDVTRAAGLGLAGVISKPYLLGDLAWHLARLADSH